MQSATAVSSTQRVEHSQEKSTPPDQKIFRSDLLLVSLLLVAAAVIRLYGIAAHAPQADERLWVSRSAKVLHMLKTNPLQATTHLPHPGIPAAAAMATGQWLNHKLSAWAGYQKPALTERHASRIAMALLACLIVPLLFYGTRSVIGSGPALLATGLFAFDPKFIGLSRLAHIDTTLTIIVTATILLYFQSVRRGSLLLKILAGIFWGLCICTKPTSVAIIAIFFIWRGLRVLLSRHLSEESEKGLISWSDLWAILIGHITLACLYTRLWTHRSEYHDRMHIRVKIAGWLWRTGKALQPHLTELLILCAVALLFSLLMIGKSKRGGRRIWFHAGMTGFTAVSIFSTFLIFPQVYENFARYWKWVFSLSSTPHESFSRVVIETPGYLHFFLTELTPLTCAGFIVGVFVLGFSLFRNFDVKSMEQKVFLLGVLLVPVFWTSIIGVSSKRAWRYALPSAGFMYIITAIGIWFVFDRLLRTKHRPLLLRTAVFATIGWQGICAALWFPHYQIYFNSISGGLPGAITRGHPFVFSGQNDAVTFLMKERGRQRLDSLLVTAFGDSESLEAAAISLFPNEPDKALEFKYYKPFIADYAIAFDSHKHLIPRKGWEPTLATKPVFESRINGARVLSIYKVPPFLFSPPLVIGALDGHHMSGREGRVPGMKGSFLTALPERDREGAIFFSSGYRAQKGIYTISVEMLTFGKKHPSSSDIVAELQMGDCKKYISIHELSKELKPIQLQCTKTSDGRIRPVIFWKGTFALAVKRLIIERLSK